MGVQVDPGTGMTKEHRSFARIKSSRQNRSKNLNNEDLKESSWEASLLLAQRERDRAGLLSLRSF